ncbi:DUF2065 domain-containing protein [Pseudoprimorskyibacter insulae]|uniref:Inner membrane protein YjeT n=1 Tax=Pseudoprimorskyibacter insulae TaxID=1695997 RepID=A0A2R8AYF4_9RHOB|nr:hypothetical protein PRI8871_02878 [Pseudoprimorskyibacter insulae]
MIADLATAIGIVLIFEGLVFALAPSYIERMLEALRLLPEEALRLLGLLSAITGLAMLWAVYAL